MPENIMEKMLNSSHFSAGNMAYIEKLYETYLRDPDAVAEKWRNQFAALPRLTQASVTDLPHSPIREHFLLLSKHQQTLTSRPHSEKDWGLAEIFQHPSYKKRYK